MYSINEAQQRRREVVALIEKSSLPLEPLAQLLLPAVHLSPASADQFIPTGFSKFGGLPDLPVGSRWPAVTLREDAPHLIEGVVPGVRRYLPFLCQIALEEVAPFDLQGVLPKQGILLFFFDVALDVHYMLATGGEKVPSQAWKILYGSADQRLQRTEPPASTLMMLQGARTLRPSLEWMLPAPSVMPQAIVGTQEQEQAYRVLMHELARSQMNWRQDRQTSFHHLLGYAHPSRGDLATDLSTRSGGRIARSAWRLLLQLYPWRSDADLAKEKSEGVYFCLSDKSLVEKHYGRCYGLYRGVEPLGHG